MSMLLDHQMSAVTPTAANPPAGAATRPPRILCIDDDPDIHTSIELRMREFEVEVDHAYYGMQGIIDALGQNPDLILTDIAMPNGDGGYLVENIRRNSATAHVPIVVLSGMRDPAVRGRVLKAGADVFLPKPIRFADLLSHVEKFIDLRRRED